MVAVAAMLIHLRDAKVAAAAITLPAAAWVDDPSNHPAAVGIILSITDRAFLNVMYVGIPMG